MNKLSSKRMSASELSSKLKMPISTIEYNIDLLIKTGLIKKVSYNYSEKGKKVYYYEPSKKMILISPNSSTDSMLETVKNKLLLPLIILTTAVTGFLLQNIFYTSQTQILSKESALMGIEDVSVQGIGSIVEPTLSIQPWLIFLFGGLFVSIIFVLMYLIKRRR